MNLGIGPLVIPSQLQVIASGMGLPSSPGLPLSYSYLCGPFILCYTEVVQSAPGSSSGGIALYVGIDQMYPRGGDELKIFIGYLGQPPSYFF